MGTRQVEFDDPLLLRIVTSNGARSQLQHISDAHGVVLSLQSPEGITLSLSDSKNGDLVAAEKDLEILTRSLAQRVTTEPLVLHCSSIPLLVSDGVVGEVGKRDAEYGVDIFVVTTSGDFVPFSTFVSTVAGLKSSCEVEVDSLLQLSQVSRFAEMELNRDWCYDNALAQMQKFPQSINKLLNKTYYPFRRGLCRFSLDSIMYTVDFLQMTVVQDGSQKSGQITSATPVWTCTNSASVDMPCHTFDAVTSQELDLAVQYGVPGLLQLGQSQVTFDISANPVILYDMTTESKFTLHRKPPLPESRECMVTLAIRCRSEDRPQVELALTTVLKKQEATQTYNVPPNTTLPLQCLLVNIARQFCVRSHIAIDIDTSAVTMRLSGEKETVCAVKMHLLEVFQQKVGPILSAETPLAIPHQWTLQQQSAVETVPVVVGGEEWNELQCLLKKSLPSVKLLQVIRVQNLTIWRRYSFFKSLMSKRGHGQVNEKLLFHGTRDTDPQTIISSEKGFDFRYGTDECLWGKGTYFAVDASYCDSRFAYHSSGGKRQIFVARVLTGRSITLPQCKANRALKEPPRISNSAQDTYDSVNGMVCRPVSTQVYVVYDHDKAYPAYLLTYRH